MIIPLMVLALLTLGCENPFGGDSDFDQFFDPAEEFSTDEEEEVVDTLVDEDLGPAPTVTALVSDTTYAQSKAWGWGCDQTNCTYRYRITTEDQATPTGDYSETDTVTLDGVTGTYYIHVQARSSTGVESAVVAVLAKLDASGPAFSSEIAMSGEGDIFTSPTMAWPVGVDAHAGLSHYHLAVAVDNGDGTCNATDFTTTFIDWKRVPASVDVINDGWQLTNNGTDGDNNTMTILFGSDTYCSAVRGADNLGNYSYIYSDTWTVFTPKSVSNLHGWWDASTTANVFTDSDCSASVASSGDSVACWRDLSGNDFHAINETAASQPVFRTGILNNLPGIRFSGAQQLKFAEGNSGPFNTIDTGEFTIFLIVKINATGGDQWVFSNWDATLGIQFGSDASDKIASHIGDDGAAGTTHNTAGSYRFFLLQRIGTTYAIIRDQDATQNFTRADSLAGSVASYFGRRGNSAADFFDGDLMEVVVLNEIPSNEVSNNIGTYFETKWGLNIIP